MGDTGLGLGLLAMTMMLALTVLALGAVNRLLEPKDPRRVVASRAIVWIGTALLLAILLLIRQ